MSSPPSWTVSVISHGHGAGLLGILGDLHQRLSGRDYHIVVTHNLPEQDTLSAALTAEQRAHTSFRTNATPAGFGANHNAALIGAQGDHVLMVDPDLRLPVPLFDALDAALAKPSTAIVSPQARTPEGLAEDNGRPLLTPLRLLRRYLLGRARDTRRLAHAPSAEVDWLAGLFLAMRRADFEALGGFDTRYYMYAEDIDLCLRAQLRGGRCLLLQNSHIVHPARRATLSSRQHLVWHLRSLLRLWRSPVYHNYRRQQKTL